MATTTDKPRHLQDAFLNRVRKDRVPVTVYLVNGVKLQGAIRAFDNFCLLLARDGRSQLVYKHAVSTVMPGKPVDPFRSDVGESDGGESDRGESDGGESDVGELDGGAAEG